MLPSEQPNGADRTHADAADPARARSSPPARDAQVVVLARELDLERELASHAMRSLSDERARRFEDLHRIDVLAHRLAVAETERTRLAARLDEALEDATAALAAHRDGLRLGDAFDVRVASPTRREPLWARLLRRVLSWLGARDAEAEAHADARLVRASALFDAAWYRATYPDVVQSGLDPALHFVRFGAREGRSPGPRFDMRAYLEAYPDIAAAGVNPLVHYVLYGRREGRERPRLP